MNDPQRWHPSTAEVEAILVELRPIIDEFARRDRAELARASR